MDTYSKLIGCNIHQSIRVHSMALKIIDTPEFQRMRYIKQLGLCYYVYPSASHSRFEHSLGVYHLTGKILDRILLQYPHRKYDIIELGSTELTPLIVECIKIAGLCHDIGHGPFSHIFDDVLLANSTNINKHHETRSCLITEIICKRELNKELSQPHISFIKNLIHPGPTHRGALYQIVANQLNGIDVDKFDYLVRDAKNLGITNGFTYTRLIDEVTISEIDTTLVNNQSSHSEVLCYPKHSSMDVYDLFHARYIMHKKVYSHKTVKLIEMMLSDIFKKVDPILKISESINDMNKFCQFTDDSIINMIENIINPPIYCQISLSEMDMQSIKEAYQIYHSVITRKLYKHITELSHNFNVDEFIKYLTMKYPDLIVPLDFETYTIHVGFVGDPEKDPFDDIYFYDKKEGTKSFKISRSEITCCLNETIHEEHTHMVLKKHDLYELVMKELENYKIQKN